MTEYGDIPGVSIDIKSPESVSAGPDIEYVHLDDTDELDHTKKFTVYVYRDEDRYDELAETITEYRHNYVFATGIVWPSWMRDEMPLETDVLLALEWAIALGGKLDPDLLASVQSELRKEENT